MAKLPYAAALDKHTQFSSNTAFISERHRLNHEKTPIQVEKSVFDRYILLYVYTYVAFGYRFNREKKLIKLEKYVKMVQECGKNKNVAECTRTHVEIIKAGLENNDSIKGHLVRMYLNCECIEEGRKIFNKMQKRDVLLWTSMINACVNCGEYTQALELFEDMKYEAIPDKVTFTVVLGACGHGKMLREGRNVHEQVKMRGLENDNIIQSALFHMYTRVESLEDACEVFNKISNKSISLWTSMISAYAKKGIFLSALELLDKVLFSEARLLDKSDYALILSTLARQIPSMTEKDTLEIDLKVATKLRTLISQIYNLVSQEGLDTDKVIGTALLQMYGKYGSPEDARIIFENIPDKDRVSWNLMIKSYVEHEQYIEALKLFQSMHLDGYALSDSSIFPTMLFVCGKLAALNEGIKLHQHIIECGTIQSAEVVQNALVGMYGRCGNLTEAERVFQHIPESITSWNSILSVYSEHNCSFKAVYTFSQMLQAGIEPDHTTFQSLLSCCDVELCCRVYTTMYEEYAIVPSIIHTGCLINQMGRGGKLELAEMFINRVPSSKNAYLWMILLRACRFYGDLARAKRAARQVILRKPREAEAYIILSNIYANAGEWEMVEKLRKFMVEKNVIKTERGRSYIEIKNRIYEFKSGDSSHTEINEVYEKIKREIKLNGYIPDTCVVIIGSNEEEKENMLHYHSEKLAVVFGIMNSGPGSMLRVVKNIRICNDCHNAFKFISEVSGRNILVRDGIGLHLFKDGICSCGDYW